jgi:hypothetical protein
VPCSLYGLCSSIGEADKILRVAGRILRRRASCGHMHCNDTAPVTSRGALGKTARSKKTEPPDCDLFGEVRRNPTDEPEPVARRPRAKSDPLAVPTIAHTSRTDPDPGCSLLMLLQFPLVPHRSDCFETGMTTRDTLTHGQFTRDGRQRGPKKGRSREGTERQVASAQRAYARGTPMFTAIVHATGPLHT